jgi:hypothetical protein
MNIEMVAISILSGHWRLEKLFFPVVLRPPFSRATILTHHDIELPFGIGDQCN